MIAVLKQFRVLVRSMDTHYRRVEERSGLGGAQLWALAEIVGARHLTVGDLARKLAIHLSTASNLVKRLESMGLVERAREGEDQRVVTISATATGKKRLQKAPKPSAGILQKALMDMEARELRALHTQLEKVLQRMGRVDRRAASTPIGDILRDGDAAE
ncbi:MAG TPA: MarR family transcriptional regulator [Usitatibacter sp.]|jgi:MarR family transcriptional regulator, organic hydroperoxide resistance regulator|nr:MarR family transcriptional regulator [Usitatibacter sp.]